MTSTPCVHLNKLISHPGPIYENVNTYIGDNVDRAYIAAGLNTIVPEGIKNRSYEFQFRRKMEKVGLNPLEVDILVLRYIYSMSFREISAELGIVSTTTTYRFHKLSLDLIKKRGLPDEVD